LEDEDKDTKLDLKINEPLLTLAEILKNNKVSGGVV
jgi:hypothetical protein